MINPPLPIASRMLGALNGTVERLHGTENQVTDREQKAEREPFANAIANGPRGSIVKQVYVDRAMTAYVLHENEMQAISLMNSLSSLFFAAGSFLFSSAMAILVSGLFQEDLPDIARFFVYYGAPVLTMLSGCCFAAGTWALLKRRSIVRKIKTESRERTV
jgi:hypothetical protein